MKNKSTKKNEYRILVVDDDKDFVESMVDILELYDYVVEVAYHAEEATKKIKKFDAQIVLIDIRLGRTSGINLIPKMKKEHPGILCVIMTAYAATDTAIKAIQEGAYDYLRKPIDTDDLLATLDRCFEKIRLEEEKTLAEADLRVRNQELQKKHNIQSVLNAMLGLALRPLKFVEILDRILDQIVTVSWLEASGIIFLVEDNSKEMVLKSYREIPEELQSQCARVPLGKCLCGQVTTTKKIQFVDYATDYHNIHFKDTVAHSYYCVPILSSGKVLGVLALYVKEGHGRNNEEEDFLMAIANGLAGVIKRKQAEEALQNALTEVKQLKNRLQAENIYLQDEIKLEHNFEKIISHSKGFKKNLRKVEQVASTSSTVLILGETGTGKELLARAVHNLSNRKDRPLVKVNCAALPASLIESELFGHEKGAFTGAGSRKAGRFELADGGTIFLDEIGDLPLELQSKLLRILQEGEFERLGSSDTIKVDVRVITATNRNLEDAVEARDFREDLFYRLNVFPIKTPPLRDRKDDIPLLVNHFVKKYSIKIAKNIDSIPLNVMESLQAYHWPGNVRELENIIERAVILTAGSTLLLDELLDQDSRKPKHDIHSLKLKETEQLMVTKALEECDWVVEGKRGAAIRLGIAASTLRLRMKKYGLIRPL